MSTAGYPQILRDRWDDLTGHDKAGAELRPFWPVAMSAEYKDDSDKDQAVLTWLEETLSILETENEERASNQILNINFHNGIQGIANRGRHADFDSGMGKPTKIIMNQVRDLLQQKTSRLLRYSPKVAVSPWNNEYQDRIGARISKRTIDTIFYINDFDSIAEEVARESMLCGESFLFAEWDPYTGDKDPQAKKAKEKKIKLLDSSGEEINLETVKRVGEVTYTKPLPWFVLHQPAFVWKDVNYIFKGTIKHIDEVLAENPELSEDSVQIVEAKMDLMAQDLIMGSGLSSGSSITRDIGLWMAVFTLGLLTEYSLRVETFPILTENFLLLVLLITLTQKMLMEFLFWKM